MPTYKPILNRTRWSVFRREGMPVYHAAQKAVHPDVKTKYVFRAFQRSQHLADLETIEVRGMYKEEMCIERGKFTRFNKVWHMHTDGSMVEHDVEYHLPPFVVLYRDRLSAHKDVEENLMNAGRLQLRRIWENLDAEGSFPPEQIASCNMMEFPYSVPSFSPPRTPVPPEKTTD